MTARSEFWSNVMAIRTSESPAPIESLHDLSGRVLAHVGNASMAEVFARHADGVVLRDGAGYREARSCRGTRLLIDPEIYVRDRDGVEPGDLVPLRDGEFIEQQLIAGVSCLLAPSRMKMRPDADTVDEMLRAGEEFLSTAQREAPSLLALVPVVIRPNELEDRRWARAIESSGLPIAPIFASYDHPFSTPAALAGAYEIIEAAEFTFALRGDIGLAGLMAFGADAGAVGTSSTVRNLWLPRKNSGGSRPPTILVPDAASWVPITALAEAVMEPRADDHLRCDCPVCGAGGDVRDLLSASDTIQREHSNAAAIALVRQVATANDPVAAWKAVCERAAGVYASFDADGIMPASRPPMLDAWLTLLG